MLSKHAKKHSSYEEVVRVAKDFLGLRFGDLCLDSKVLRWSHRAEGRKPFDRGVLQESDIPEQTRRIRGCLLEEKGH